VLYLLQSRQEAAQAISKAYIYFVQLLSLLIFTRAYIFSLLRTVREILCVDMHIRVLLLADKIV